MRNGWVSRLVGNAIRMQDGGATLKKLKADLADHRSYARL